MTHQKSIPTDSHFPSTDHLPHLHAQGDIRPPSSVLGRETTNNGRCSDQSCKRQLMENNARRRNAAGATGLATTQNFTSLVKGIDHQDMTRESLEAFLTPKELDRLRLSRSDLLHFWDATVDPPVTKTSLSELDLERIFRDPKLRHNVNFDHEVSFRPNLQGEAGAQKLAFVKGYWDALVIEFQLYILRCRNIHSQCNGAPVIAESPWHLGPAIAGKLPLRLPRMFQVVNEILKTLVPESEWATVDAHLDIRLLIQELENGVCDIVALSEWLGDLLQGSCSPMRDSSVQATVTTIQKGVEKENARLIISGLKSLFGILETMKLDVANHQIRTLRLLMVDNFEQFQQNVFLCRIPREQNLRSAYSWFYTPNTMLQVQGKRGYTPSIDLFLKGVVDLVATNNPHIPSTFEYDFERLRILQIDFRICLMKSACRDIFISTLHVLGRNQSSSSSDNRDSPKNRITTFTESLDLTNDPSRHVKEIALEIVREAYRACNIESLPSDNLLAETEQRILEAWNPTSSAFGDLEHILINELGNLVDDAVESVAGLTPLQILDHLNPPAQSSKPETLQDDERSSLPDISRRIAHIAILHWRVWAPILYQQPWGGRSRDMVRIVGSQETLVPSPSPMMLEDGPRNPSIWHLNQEDDHVDDEN